MFYSPLKNGFYVEAIHSDNIPADAVEITTEEHAALLDGQSQGKIIAADKNGKPILKDPPPPTAEELQAQANADVRAYLASTDWYVVRKAETGTEIPADILAKRQAARDAVVSSLSSTESSGGSYIMELGLSQH